MLLYHHWQHSMETNMFTIMRISDVGYYISLEAEAEEHQDRMSYYVHDNGVGEDRGRWWTPIVKDSAAAPFVVRGGMVDVMALRRLAEGRHPETDELLIQRCRTERLAGYDLHLSAPKSLSVLWATSDADMRARIIEVMERAVLKTLDTVHAMGLIESRIGKGGAVRVPVSQCAAGRWLHTSARSGDPQLHVHSVLLNVCVRPDGTTGALDNAAILSYQQFIGAAFDAELSSLLRRELDLPIERVAETGSFEISGIPEVVRAAFSKRRLAIEEAAAAAGYDTADDRARAQIDALRTRTVKAGLPNQAGLEERWRQEIAECGWTSVAIQDSVRQARLDELLDAARDEIVDQIELADRAAISAVSELSKTSSVLERRHVMAAVAGRMSGIGGIDAVMLAVDRMIGNGRLVEIRDIGRSGEAVYATPATIKLEADMLRTAIARRGEGTFVTTEIVDTAISARTGITDEQAQAVRHALGMDGVTVLEGPPGAGKSYLSRPIADAARAAGKSVHVISTSWRATDVVREETGTPEEAAQCVAAFLARLNPSHREHIALDKGSMIIADEGSMLDLASMASLLAAANGARVVIIGDTLQLSAVGGGAPMAALASPAVLGTQRLRTVRRQMDDWQRDASTAFARGEHATAFKDYDDHGCVHWIDGRDAAINALVGNWTVDLLHHLEGQRLCLAYRHADVREINERCRIAARAADRLLNGPDFEVRALGRGRRAVPSTIRIARGDRIIFGEGLEINGITIRNSDTATIEAVSGTQMDPIIRVKLDKGVLVEARWSAFVGRRPYGCRAELSVPRVQHAYCVSIHSAQGLTIGSGSPPAPIHGATFVYNAGLGAQSTLVAMTRHVNSCDVYVETARIRERVLARQAARGIRVNGRGRLEAPDTEDGDRTGEVAAEDIKGAVYREVAMSESKRNCMDFANDVGEWLVGREVLGVQTRRLNDLATEIVNENREPGVHRSSAADRPVADAPRHHRRQQAMVATT